MAVGQRYNIDSSQLSAAARLFSASVIRELARKGKSKLFARLAKQSTLSETMRPIDRVRDFFDSAFLLLKRKDHRHEYVYKSALTLKVLLGTHSLRTAAMLMEFRVASCKADIVILNGTSTVYEIKSERDTLDRLKNQIAAYLQMFSRVNVITGENHVEDVLSGVSGEVGVLLLTDRFSISEVREAHENPDRIVPSVVFNSLRRLEVQRILELYQMPIPEVPNTQMRRALKEHFLDLTPRQVHDGMVKVLSTTRSPLPLRDYVEALPDSLKAAALAVRLGRLDQSRLLAAMDIELKEALSWA
jgi:hypothetical protein